MPRQPAIIFDRDGTLASVAHTAPSEDRSDRAWGAYNASLPFDAPVPTVAGLFRSVRPGVARIITSGRAEGDWPGDRRRRFQMNDWLHKHELVPDVLLMRSGGDKRRDSIVKTEMYEEHIEPHYDVIFVVDDRPQVVEAWGELGLPVLHVHDPGIAPPIAGGGEDIEAEVARLAAERAGGVVPASTWVRATVTKDGVRRRAHSRRTR